MQLEKPLRLDTLSKFLYCVVIPCLLVGLLVNNRANTQVRSELISSGKSLAQGSNTSCAAQEGDLAFCDTTSRTMSLPPGALVGIRNINGSVDVETTDGDQATIQIVRSANSREALEQQPVRFKVQNDLIAIYGVPASASSSQDATVRQRVKLTLPRRASIVANTIHGSVKVGESEGMVRLEKVNGSVQLKVRKGSSIETGLSDINGSVSLQLFPEAQTRIAMEAIRGSVSAGRGFMVKRKAGSDNYEVKVGNGKGTIKVARVNGSVRVERPLPKSNMPNAIRAL